MNREAVAIIVTYNSADHIGASLGALRAADIEVIVVDNASMDATVDVVRRRFPDVLVLENDVNVGFARGVNQALAGARCETVLLVNPDCVVPPETAHELVDFVVARPNVALAGPRIFDAHGKVTVSAHPFESLTSVVLSRFGGSLVPVGIRRAFSGRKRRRTYDACRGPGAATSVDWLSGACLAVRVDLLRGLGGLDERYFMYYEDEELCWQARRLGNDVVYRPDLAAVHVGGASSDLGATWPHLYRSMLIFFASHRPSSYQAVRIVVLVRAGIGMALAAIRRALRRESGAARSRAWRGVALVALEGRSNVLVGAAP